MSAESSFSSRTFLHQRLEALAPLGHARAERLDVRRESELIVERDAQEHRPQFLPQLLASEADWWSDLPSVPFKLREK